MPRSNRGTSKAGPARPFHERQAASSTGTGGGRGRGMAAFTKTRAQRKLLGLGNFTLTDEARQSSHHGETFWTTKLREQPVHFVSAGAVEPLRVLEESFIHTRPSDSRDAEASAADFLVSPGVVASREPEQLDGTANKSKTIPIIGPWDTDKDFTGDKPSTARSLFFFDTTKQIDALGSCQDNSQARARRNTTESCSSEGGDVIVFKGRRNNKHSARASGPRAAQSVRASSSRSRSSEKTNKTQISKRPTHKGHPETPLLVDPGCFSPEQCDMSGNDEDAAIADYISNVRDSGDTTFHLHPKAERGVAGSDQNLITDSERQDQSDSAVLPEAIVPVRNALVAEPICNESDATPGSGINDDDTASSVAIEDLDLHRSFAAFDLGEEISKDLTHCDIGGSQDFTFGDHGDFDFMDWHRSSLRTWRRGKRPRGRIQMSLSDSEMEQTLQAAWNTDRLTKHERKKKREEMRALGLLGKQPKQPDLRMKYPKGISMKEVSGEIEDFLTGSVQSITLPPMDKHARKVIHDMANKLNLQSRSTGKNKERRTTLYRSKRTLPFNKTTFDKVAVATQRKFFSRPDTTCPKARRAGVTPGMSLAAANVAEGEIVGGLAPELGVDNRGRSILEKMGWSNGMALGSLGNEGILQPVAQAMKKSKAGLG